MHDKKVLALLLAALMVFSISACSKPEPQPTPPEDPGGLCTDPVVFPAETDYAVFNGIYRDPVPEQEGETGYVEITAYNDLILLEHFLCMDGSVYSFWAEEFWPSTGYYPNGEYPSVYGKSQTFSSMTHPDIYEDMPKNRSITLTEDGVVLNYDDSDAEYYILDNSFFGHSSAEDMRGFLGEDVTSDFGALYGSEEVLGIWSCRDGQDIFCLSFSEDGTFSMLRKSPGTPVAAYRGVFAFGEHTGNLEICAERTGCGKYPYMAGWEWSAADGSLSLLDKDGTILTPGKEYNFRPVQDLFFTELTQQDALSYLYNSYHRTGQYTDQYGTEYSYRYALPQFYGYSEAVTEVNQTLTDTFFPFIEMEEAAMEAGEFLSYDTVNWEAEIFEGVLYLHIYAVSFNWEEHAAFYLDVATGDFLDTEQVLDRLLIDPGYFLQAVKDGAEEVFLELHKEIPKEDREKYGYYDMLQWTVSQEAVNFDLPIFVDRCGSIAVYAKIGTLAGAGIMWEILRPFDGAVG